MIFAVLRLQIRFAAQPQRTTEVFMKTFKKVLSIIMVAALVATIFVVATVSSGATATGAGLAEWALRAYNEGWSYSWGGSEPGAVDCSGLIWSYCGGDRTAMLDDAQANGRDWGYVSDGVPNVHGLGLSRPGHVGVYIGEGMEVDARGDDYGVCYEEIGGYNNWDCWFKLTAVSYVENGWEEFNGNTYYYVNGEYITNTTRTIDGVTYSFDASGICSDKPASTTSSSTKSTSNNSNSNSKNTTAKPAEDNGPLKNGSTGSKVEELQKRLQELGYYNGSIDGDFGSMTEEAFKLFQKQAGLTVDGIAGADADYLYSDEAPAYAKPEEATEAAPAKKENEVAETGENEVAAEEPTEAPTEAATEAPLSYALGDYADEIALIQERLVTLGYLETQPDGAFGAKTETAVKDFQNVNQLVETGVVDETTYDAIFSDEAIEMPVEETVEATEAPAAAPAEVEKKEANLPKAVVTPSAAPNTEVEKKSAEVSTKSLVGVTNSVDMQKNAKANNYQFILWLGVMIVVLVITFTIVFMVEKKKQKKAASSKRFY